MKKYHFIIIGLIFILLMAILVPILNYYDYDEATKGIKKNPNLIEDTNFTLATYSKYENCDQIFIYVIIPSTLKGILKSAR